MKPTQQPKRNITMIPTLVLFTLAFASFLRADPLDNWTNRTSGVTSDLVGLDYGKGTYVVVGTGGTILTSPDSIGWTNHGSVTPLILSGVAYGNDTFVIVGRGGSIFTSTDATSWVPRPSGTSADFSRVYFLNGQFIAVGELATIATSLDGIMWTFRESGIVNSNSSQGVLYQMAYGNGVYVIGGQSSTILTSPDSVHWTARDIGPNYPSIAYGNGLFVMNGYQTTSTSSLLTSFDGITWTPPIQLANRDLILTFGKGNFVGVGDAILTSTDGANWTWRVSSAIGLSNVKYVNHTFMAVGNNGTILQTATFGPPEITQQPRTQFAVAGGNPGFEVLADGSAPLFYQWRFSQTNLTGQTDLINETNSILTLTNVAVAQSGVYSVRLSNSLGIAVSSNAILSVSGVQDADGDGIPDFWELLYGLNPSDPLDANTRRFGDQMTYLQKYLLGLNPLAIDNDVDGLNDYDEVFLYHTNPLSADTDGDGIPDKWEIEHRLNPLLNDANDEAGFDGVSNMQVYQYNLIHTNQLDPHNAFFAPGTSIYEVINNGQHTNRIYYDRIDRLEGMETSRGVSFGYKYDGNGNLTNQAVLSRTSETNGLPVLWRYLNGFTNDPSPIIDSDGDGWTDYQEWKAGSDPRNPASTPNLLGNPGTNIASLVLPFTPSNFVVGVGQLDGTGAEEIVIGVDGNPGTNTNFLLVLTQGPVGWSTQRVDLGPFGLTSIAIGQPTNRPNVGIYVGLRETNGNGRVMEYMKNGSLWQSNLVAVSTNGAAFVAGVRPNRDLLANTSTNGLAGGIWSLTFSNASWGATLISSNASHRGIPSHDLVWSRTQRDSTIRLLDTGGIEVVGGDTEFYKDDIPLPADLLLSPVTGKWHLKTPSAMTWIGASNYFGGFHGRVALPTNGFENAWFSSFVSQGAWIGLYWTRDGTSFEPPNPYFSDGTAAPRIGNAPYYSGYTNWHCCPPQPAFPAYPLPSFTEINYGGSGEWGIQNADVTLLGIGEIPNPVSILTNRWLIAEAGTTNHIVSRSLQLKTGRARPTATNQTSLYHCFVDDRNASGTIDGPDVFVFAEYQISGNNVTTTTLTNLSVGSSILAQTFGLAAVDFLGSGAGYVFTAEPSGAIGSWSTSNPGGPLDRQLFCNDYSGKAWHALAGVKMAASGEGLAGLLVDPTNPNQCKVIFWPPQSVLSSPQSGIVETAPSAAVLPSTNALGSISTVSIRLWDAEGNASAPLLQYRVFGSTAWQTATVAFLDGSPYNPSIRLSTLPSGVNHTLTWNAVADLGPAVVTNVLLRARAQDFALVGDWSLPTPFQVNMSQDSNTNGIPDWWELQYFGNLSRDGNGDYDGDGFSDRAEYIADTDPTNPNSYLRLTGALPVAGGMRIEWMGGILATQYLQQKASFGLPSSLWLDIFTNPPPTPITSSFTNAFGTNNAMFYRVRVVR